MNFEKIDIYGFKSFADKVEIKFEDGITAIVGPNGCGKSNVADSIRFVMGESSAKSMRGSSMQDVIFNGTEKRKPLSYCEVSLYFNNKNKIFNLDYEEVILTRKLYKSGESEYLINKNLCRRKDIVDAFRQIGLGKESYCVIGQGKIDSLLSAKPEDRRNVFEEAAGISKFKEEKASSENKLAGVNDNLNRINDILGELDRQLGPLKKQAENAKEFLNLSNRLKVLETNIYIYNYDNSSIEKQKIYDVISGINEEIALKQAEFEASLSKYEYSQSQIDGIDDEINKLRDELLNLTVSLEKQNGEVNVYREKISILSEQNDKNLASKNMLEFTLKENEQKINAMKKTQDEAETVLMSLQEQKTSLESRFRVAVDKLSLGEETSENLNEEMFQALEQVGDLKSRILKFETEKESLSQKQNEINLQKENNKSNINNTKEKLTQAEKEIDNIDDKIEKEKDNKQKLFEKISLKNEELSEFENELESKKIDYHSAVSRLELLNEMKEYNEGYAISVKRLLEQAQSGSSIGGKVVGAVASLMQVPEKLEVAIEMALGASIQNIVTKNEDDAKSLIEYLKTNKFGRVTFLPISGVKERILPQIAQQNLKMNGVLGIASDLISFEKKYQPIFSSLLGSTVITDNLDNAIMFSRATNGSCKIVTLDGDIISPQGSMTGGSRKENSTNLLGRDREIETLKALSEKLDSEINKLFAKIVDINSELKLLNENVDSINDEIYNLDLQKTKITQNIDSLEQDIDDLDEEERELDISFSEVLDKLDFVEKELERLKVDEQNINDKKNETSQNKKDVNETYSKLRQERDEAYAKLDSIRTEIDAKQNELNFANSELEKLKISSAESEYRLNEAILDIQKNTTQIDDYETQINKILETTTFADKSKEIDEVKQKIAGESELKKNFQMQMSEADNQKMMLSNEIQHANEKKSKEESKLIKIDTDLENLQNRIWEAYEMTYADAKKLYDENFNINVGSIECADIKKKIQHLGNVNLSAIEDVKSVGERYEEMSKQRDDMTKAKDDLMLIIADLTQKMEEKFKSCFERIRANFQIIFRELFGGGRADICLNDENNILECGIDIIAEPPGKRLQNISLLSGGERALTAVAILFSILRLRSMPFCVLDEIEAALDDANVERYAKYLHRYTGETQFIVITHRKPTMELADSLYGVTMEEKGVSKVVSVKLNDAIKIDGSEQ